MQGWFNRQNCASFHCTALHCTRSVAVAGTLLLQEVVVRSRRVRQKERERAFGHSPKAPAKLFLALSLFMSEQSSFFYYYSSVVERVCNIFKHFISLPMRTRTVQTHQEAAGSAPKLEKKLWGITATGRHSRRRRTDSNGNS